MRLTPQSATALAPAPVETAVAGAALYWLAPDATRQRIAIHGADCADPADVRSPIHGYGGGALAAASGSLWFVDDRDQRVYRRFADGRRFALTPGEPRGTVYHADFAHDARHGRLLCVEERHRPDGRVENRLVGIADDGTGHINGLVEGEDFVGWPRIDPSGRRLAWVSWSLPDMPWDKTRLWVADIAPEGLIERRCIGEGASIVDPLWAPDGTLYYLSDEPGYWMLHRWNGTGHTRVAETADLSIPQLRLNFPRYAVIDDTTVIAAETVAAVTRLIRIDPRSGEVAPIDLPFVDIQSVRRAGDDQVAFVGTVRDAAPALVRLHLPSGAVEVIHRFPAPAIDAPVRPRATAIAARDGAQIHAFHYPTPAARNGASPPPLIVNVHGGPVNHIGPALSPQTQFWLEQGFSWLDVNYRGSSGYGRAYRHALRGQWGARDWQDVVDTADHAVAQGWADPARLVVRGASAGGFSVMCALAHSDRFAAGASYWGVSDLAQFIGTTHKFESGYLQSLVGRWPDAAGLYRERSPLNHIATIRAPLMLIQGTGDAVVPTEQARSIAEALERRGNIVEAHYFEGEGHGFRAPAARAAALEAELAFYCKLFWPD